MTTSPAPATTEAESTPDSSSVTPAATAAAASWFGSKLQSELQEGREFWSGYVERIDFSEPFLLGLGAFHLITFFMVLASRRRPMAQNILGLTLVVLVLCAQQLNEMAAMNWR
eukprot:UC1_evm1s1133